MLQPPCYDPRTHTDCPLRTISCHTTCDKWQAFEKVKAEHYAKREQEFRYNNQEFTYQRTLSKRIERRRHKR